MDKNSPFAKLENKTQERKVTGFPSKQWRDTRAQIKSSTDPIHVALSEGHPRALHREVDMIMDNQPRQNIFQKATQWLGLTE